MRYQWIYFQAIFLWLNESRLIESELRERQKICFRIGTLEHPRAWLAELMMRTTLNLCKSCRFLRRVYVEKVNGIELNLIIKTTCVWVGWLWTAFNFESHWRFRQRRRRRWSGFRENAKIHLCDNFSQWLIEDFHLTIDISTFSTSFCIFLFAFIASKLWHVSVKLWRCEQREWCGGASSAEAAAAFLISFRGWDS